VRVGAISDEGTVSDPETILARFHDEFDALLALATRDGRRAGETGQHEPASPEMPTEG
jgi:hypothetical protein